MASRPILARATRRAIERRSPPELVHQRGTCFFDRGWMRQRAEQCFEGRAVQEERVAEQRIVRVEAQLADAALDLSLLVGGGGAEGAMQPRTQSRRIGLGSAPATASIVPSHRILPSFLVPGRALVDIDTAGLPLGILSSDRCHLK